MTRPNFPKRAIITGGMPYGNKTLHFGHIGGMFVHADVFARFLRDRIGKENVVFVSGTDCYGSPIAEGYGKKVEQEGKKLVLQLDLDDQMRIQNDFWKSTRKTIDSEIREFLLTANVGKRAGHTNSQEFEQMRSSLFYLSGVKLENKEITNNLTPEEFLKRLVIVKQAAKDYIKAKEDETFAWGTTMRKTRLDYARRLENYANRKLVEITDMMKKNNELNEKIASAKLLEPLYGNNPSKIINEVINKPILARKKAEEEKKLAEQKKKGGRKRQSQQPAKGGSVLA